MLKRATLFVLWAFLGAVLSYAALYAFTPFGLMLIAAVLVAATLLPAVGGSRLPEMLGLLAGPGAFAFLIATGTDEDSAPFWVAGAVICLAAIASYLLIVRARGARSA